VLRRTAGRSTGTAIPKKLARLGVASATEVAAKLPPPACTCMRTGSQKAIAEKGRQAWVVMLRYFSYETVG
jgi:hypothetical protein